MAKLILVVTAAEAEALHLAQVFRRQPGAATTIRWAGTLADALAALQDWVADLILAECTLADSAGRATIAALQAACPRSPILILTDAGHANPAGAAQACGAAAYLLSDHYDNYLLPQAVNAILERGMAEDQYESHRARAAPPWDGRRARCCNS